MSLLALSLSKSRKKKGHFSLKMNVTNDNKTLELAKSVNVTGNICDCLWALLRRE